MSQISWPGRICRKTAGWRYCTALRHRKSLSENWKPCCAGLTRSAVGFSAQLSLGGAQQTMRWASPGVNLYNTVRDVYGNPDEIAADNGLSTKKPEHKEQIKYLQEVALWTAIEAGRRGDPEHIRSLYETEKKDAQDRPYTHGVLTWISRMTRRTLCVPEGYTMPNGDFSQIEARITDWFAQQLDMLQAFASGQDVYTIKATGIYKQPIEQITKPDDRPARFRSSQMVSEADPRH